MKIPSMDFRGSKFVNEDGTLSSVAQAFFDALNNVLIKNAGDEGLVAPSVSNDSPNFDLDTIQDNTNTSATGIVTHTCEFGTFVYDSTTNKVKVTLNDGTGAPLFKEVLTA